MNQTLKDYAIWQAISDLEMYCRSRRNGTYLQDGEGFLMFMRQNKYKQQAFDRYLYMRGIK